MRTGPYDRLYSAADANILWGQEPGRLIKRADEFGLTGRILDAGCGDGKNALFLEDRGFHVTGYDCCETAIRGLHNRFERVGRRPGGHYEVRDVCNPLPNGTFDAIVSYGLYHCLPATRRLSIHAGIVKHLKVEGKLVFTCLTDSIPLPANHGTQAMVLPNRDEVIAITQDLDVIYMHEGTIAEEHFPSTGQHVHSAIWLVARRRAVCHSS